MVVSGSFMVNSILISLKLMIVEYVSVVVKLRYLLSSSLIWVIGMESSRFSELCLCLFMIVLKLRINVISGMR